MRLGGVVGLEDVEVQRDYLERVVLGERPHNLLAEVLGE